MRLFAKFGKYVIFTLLLCLGAFGQNGLSPVAKQIFFGTSGSYIDKPLAGGKIYTYAAGTTTPAATYSSSSGGANTNPIILDAAGFADIWLTPGASYKFLVQDANSVQQYTVDNISTAVSGGAGCLSIGGTGQVLFNNAGACAGSANLFWDNSASALTSTSINGAINAAMFAGADIGAKHNAAAATCTSGQPCNFIIPPSAQVSFTTSIVLVANETLECTAQGYVDNQTTTGQQLNYTGTGTAITIDVDGARLKGCNIALGSSTVEGVRIGGASHAYSVHVEDMNVYGGGTSTILYRVSGSGGVEDAHIEHSRGSNFTGVGIQVDHANDTFLEHLTFYGHAGNTTGITLLLDSNAGGTHITDFTGGNSGLHGLVVQNTLGGNPPTWIFAKGFVSDLASSDGWLFAAGMAGANIGGLFTESWSAGSGGCGVKNAGAAMLTISNSNIRDNAQSGICDSSVGHGNVYSNNLILGNNQSNAGYSGFDFSNHPGSRVVTNNLIQNYPEVGGFQQYAINAASDVEGLTFTGNSCDHNVVGCQNLGSVTATKLQACDNVSGTTTVPCLHGGAATIGGVLTVNGINFASVTPINGLAGNAVNLRGGAGATDDFAVQTSSGTNNFIVHDNGTAQFLGTITQSGGTPIPTYSGSPTVNAGVCWKTATQLGTCTAGTWPNCTTCN